MPTTSSPWTAVGAADVARAEQAQRHQRVLDPRLADEEGDDRRDGHRAQPERAGRAPALLLDLEDRVDAEHQAAGEQRRAGRVGAVAEPEALARLDQPQREERGRHADGDVHEEDPVPVDEVGQHAAGEQADRAARGGDEAVDADRLRLVTRLGEHGHDHPEHDGGGQRAARALDEARADQHLLALRRRAQQRRRREDREADQEHPPPADEVAEPSGEQQQAAERDQVRVDHPREVALREVQVLLDGRKRHVHDRRVEHDHQHADAQHVERQPAGSIRVGRGGHVVAPSGREQRGRCGLYTT